MNYNTTVLPFNIVSIAHEYLLPEAALNHGNSFNLASSPGLPVGFPPKHLFVSRLTFVTPTDVVLDYMKSKVGALSALPCVQLKNNSNPDRVIALIKVTHPYKCDTIGNPFWMEGVFTKPYKRKF